MQKFSSKLHKYLKLLWQLTFRAFEQKMSENTTGKGLIAFICENCIQINILKNAKVLKDTWTKDMNRKTQMINKHVLKGSTLR